MEDVTLAYLTNPAYFRDIGKRMNPSSSASDDDVRFYRRRLISLYKDLLSGEKVNESIDDAHEHFVHLVIAHFKRVDTEQVLQEEYSDTDADAGANAKDVDVSLAAESDPNAVLLKKEVAVPTLDNFIVSTKPSVPETPPPNRRVVNLRDEHFRDKGVPKKRVSIQ